MGGGVSILYYLSSPRIGKDPALESWVCQENPGKESMREIKKSKFKLTTMVVG